MSIPVGYTVNVIKEDGAKSVYHVLALSAGGAEETVLREVYAAKYAMAWLGWKDGIKKADLVSRGATIALADMHTSEKGN